MIEPTISTEMIQHLVHCIALTGREPDGLLHEFGLSTASISKMGAVMPLSDYVEFFERAAELVGNPYLGLHAARMTNSESLGPMGFLFLSAPSLQAAFDSFTKYLERMQQETTNVFSIRGDMGIFSYLIRDDRIYPRRQDNEYSIAATCNLVRQYLRPGFTPAEVHFEHEMVGSYSTYHEYFGCPVFFAQPQNSFEFPSYLLSESSARLSNRLFPIISHHLQAMKNDNIDDQSLKNRIIEMLTPELLENSPTLKQIARALGKSPSTLIRQLASENSSYRSILKQQRMALAERLLLESKRPVADIALALGYAENASFSRAFKLHFGISPATFRKSHRSKEIG